MASKSKPQNSDKKPESSIALPLIGLVLIVAFTLFVILRSNHRESSRADPEASINKDIPKRPILSLDRRSHDFGSLSQNATRETTFQLRNTGTLPLILGTIRTGCNCIKTSVLRSTIPAGEKTTLKVTLVTGLKAQAFQYDLVIQSNDPNNPEFHIDLLTEVTTPLIITPTPIQFGLVKNDEAKTVEAKLKSRSGEPFKILNIESSREEFSVTEEIADKSSKEYIIKLSARPLPDSQKLANFIIGKLTITTNIDKGTPTQIQILMQTE